MAANGQFEGLVFPTLVVRDLVEEIVAAMLADDAIIDLMLASRPQEDIDSMRTALKDRPVKVVLGYPLEAPEDATISVVLADDGEVHPTVGDLTASEKVATLQATLAQSIGAEEGAELVLVGGIPAGLPSSGGVVLGTEVAVYAIDGDPAVMTLPVRGMQATVAIPHNADDLVVLQSLYIRRGWSEVHTIRLDVFSSSAWFVDVFGRMLKAYLIFSSGVFENEGMTLKAQVRSSGLAPRPVMFPAHIHSQTLTLQLQTEVSLPETLPVITGIAIDLQTDGTALGPGPLAPPGFEQGG